MALARSYLFVPANRPERIAKARASGADAVIVDLEDAVPPQDKERAREQAAGALDEANPVIVRINAAGTRWFADDLELCRRPGVSAVMLPKSEGIDAVCATVENTCRDVLALIETARGIDGARAIAQVPGVTRLVFGSIDLQLDLGVEGEDEELHWYRSQLVLASRLGGLAAPVDGVTSAIDDDQRLGADVRRAMRFGFGAKLCIHPRQVAGVHAAFAPTPEQIEWARRVLEADARAGGAAFALDGRMIDTPVVRRATTLLGRAGISVSPTTPEPGENRA